MLDIWRRNMAENMEQVQQDAGPALVMVVSGSQSDQIYWRDHLLSTRRDVFRQDGATRILSVYEKTLRGNYLGTFHAWAEAQHQIATTDASLPNVGLMTMVFGKGTRLSPFTQALGNRKSAFPTPLKAKNTGSYLRTVDLANLYANGWLKCLGDGGFRGVVVKWGDEAVVPGSQWQPRPDELKDLDAVRFIWETDITEDLAREKEWVVIDAQTGLMRQQLARQNYDTLRTRVANLGEAPVRVGVNLGSLAISYQFLDTALEILGDDVYEPAKWANWDPYAWIALCCRTEEEWGAEAEIEERSGQTGIRDLEARYPDFYDKIAQVRAALEGRTGRRLAVGVLDFGEAYWCDLGLHRTLRETLQVMTSDSKRGQATRDLFAIPHNRDERGNIILDSQVPPGAEIRGSIIADSVIFDPDSVVRDSVVIGGRHGCLNMPDGGCALFCAVDDLRFTGPKGIAFRALASEIVIEEGGRHTTLLLPHGREQMVSNESILDFKGENYTEPILGNRLSFEKAGQLLAEVDGHELEARWQAAWQGWL